MEQCQYNWDVILLLEAGDHSIFTLPLMPANWPEKGNPTRICNVMTLCRSDGSTSATLWGNTGLVEKLWFQGDFAFEFCPQSRVSLYNITSVMMSLPHKFYVLCPTPRKSFPLPHQHINPNWLPHNITSRFHYCGILCVRFALEDNPQTSVATKCSSLLFGWSMSMLY